MNPRHLPGIIVSSVLLLLEPSSARGSVMSRMSFEEATQYSDAVVLGTVNEVPALAALDPQTGEVMRRNHVTVERYLKGSGDPEISVLTLGGPYLAETPKGKEQQFVNYGGEPQLPIVGTTVLLFLRHFGKDGAFIVCSATHGVREVAAGQAGHDRTVTLAFRRPEVMTPSARKAYDEMVAHGYRGTQELFMDTVAVSELPDLVLLADKKRRPAEALKPSGTRP